MVSKSQVIPSGMPSLEERIVETATTRTIKFHHLQGRQWNLFDLLDCLSLPCSREKKRFLTILHPKCEMICTHLNVTNLSLIIWNLLSDINSGSSRTASSTHTTIFFVWKHFFSLITFNFIRKCLCYLHASTIQLIEWTAEELYGPGLFWWPKRPMVSYTTSSAGLLDLVFACS